MDGGVDAAITQFFGKQLQKKVQKYIISNYEGEQPVGTSFIIETGVFILVLTTFRQPRASLFSSHAYDGTLPFFFTLQRVPYSIEGTDYVYLATKALLNAIRRFNDDSSNTRKIQSVACTGDASGYAFDKEGLGTFYGKMKLSEAGKFWGSFLLCSEINYCFLLV